jgi:hypothetical protein
MLYNVRTKKNMHLTPRSNSYKFDRSGAWQPYVPKIGVPRGCRTGVSTPNERFHIQHIAAKYSDPAPFPKESPTGIQTSQIGPDMVPIDSSSTNSHQKRSIEASWKSNIGYGLTPSTDVKLVRRPQQGRTNIQSDEPTERTRGRTNKDTLKPPDNIALGLVPLIDTGIECLRRSRHPHHNASSLGSDFQPTSDVKEEAVERPNVETTLPTSYVRVYGVS